jgi:hypothetical protein
VLNDDAIFTAAKGYIYIGEVGTASVPTPALIQAFRNPGFDPDAADVLGTGWSHIGHTAREELPEFGFDGGEAETRGTWQNEAVKQVITEALVDYVTFNLHQFDDQALSIYYGQANAAGAVEGEFIVSGAPTAGVEKSLCMVMVDGDAAIGFYARKASLLREGAVTLAVDEFSALPLRATFLKDGSNPLYRWISLDMGINPTAVP